MKNKIVFLVSIVCVLISLSSQAAKVKMLASNEDALQARVDVIKQAQKEIFITYFIVRDDAISRGAFAFLLDAANRGVKVKVILDGISQKISVENLYAMNSHPNIEIKLFNHFDITQPLEVLKRIHEKLLIGDIGNSYQFITGGRNVSDKYFGFSKHRNFDDLDIYVEGDTALQVRDYYLELWKSPYVHDLKISEIEKLMAKSPSYMYCGAAYCMQQKEQMRKKVYDAFEDLAQRLREVKNHETPIDWSVGVNWQEKAVDVGEVLFLNDPPSEKKRKSGIATFIYELFVNDTSIKEVTILSPYIILTDRAKQALLTMVERGVKIKVITNSLNSTDNVLAQAGYNNDKLFLLYLGVEIYEYLGPDTMHGKAAFADGGRLSVVGSYNFDPRSSKYNREIAVAFDASNEPEVLKDIHMIIDHYQSKAKRIEDMSDQVDSSWLKETLLQLLRPVMKINVFKEQL